MTDWYLPTEVTVNGKTFKIYKDCEYRTVLDTMIAMEDVNLTNDQQSMTAMLLFYDDLDKQKLSEEETTALYKRMIEIIEGGETINENRNTPQQKSPIRLMDWEHDFKYIAPAVSLKLGYDIRGDKYTHWYTFWGAYIELGDCTYNTTVNIRSKKSKGTKLEKGEQEFYRENRADIDLPQRLTDDELQWIKEHT